jgi:hypothetical protein
MSRVNIGNIAGRVVLSIENADEYMSVELTINEAIKVAEILDIAIFEAGEGSGFADSFRGFIAGLED